VSEFRLSRRQLHFTLCGLALMPRGVSSARARLTSVLCRVGTQVWLSRILAAVGERS
jgi:hypothetical protein